MDPSPSEWRRCAAPLARSAHGSFALYLGSDLTCGALTGKCGAGRAARRLAKSALAVAAPGGGRGRRPDRRLAIQRIGTMLPVDERSNRTDLGCVRQLAGPLRQPCIARS